MFLIYQIPFVDIRMLTNSYDYCNFYPHTFSPSTKQPKYFRFLGSEHPRSNGEQLPESEKTFYETSRILSLSDPANHEYKIVFQRLFTDSLYLHFDVGLHIDDKVLVKTGKNIITIIKMILQEKIFTVQSDTRESICLNSLNRFIEQYYLYATARKIFIQKEKIKRSDSNVVFGCAGVFVEYNESLYPTEILESNKSVIPVNFNLNTCNLERVTLYKFTTKAEKNDKNCSHIWFLRKEFCNNYKNTSRELRICLSKLHCYREGIGAILHYINSTRLFSKIFDYDLLNTNLSSVYELVNCENYHNIEFVDMMSISFNGEFKSNSLTWNQYLNRIKRYLYLLNHLERKSEMNQTNKIQIISNGSTGIMDSTINGNIYNNEIESFEEEFEKLLYHSNLTENDKQNLIKSKEEFINQIKQPENKSDQTPIKAYEHLKHAISALIKNASSISTLFEIGTKIINMIYK